MIRKEIVQVDHDVVRVTVADERWYARTALNATTGLPEYRYVPSITWVAGHYPKGIGFYKWLAQHGWDEAQAIKRAAADKGSKVHQACTALIDGRPVTWNDATFLNPTTGQAEAFTVEEWECIVSFVAWCTFMMAQHGAMVTLARDTVLFSDEHNVAGTMDWLVRFAREPFARLIDFKTGNDVWPEYEIQLSGYKQLLPATLLEPHGLTAADVRLGLLQLGYRRNRVRYRYHDVADQWELFLAAQRIWAKEQEGVDVFKAEYPLTVALGAAPETPPQPTNGQARRRPKTTRAR